MKYKKYFKLKYNKNNIYRYDSIHWGEIGLKSLSFANLTVEQLNATIKSLKRIIKKKNFLIVRCNPFWPLTRKPRDVRMGRGKGSPTLKINPIKAGSVLFEIKGVNNSLAVKALHYCSRRLPVKSTIVKNYDQRTNNFKGSW